MTTSPWANRPHGQLAELARELLMAGHLIDRAGMPQLIARFGREQMQQVAIDEWMAASPVYTKRMQRLLGFEGDTVEVIFKGMQLDVGAPPEFLDFRYAVSDERHGTFHLDHCGALMDVEPMGEEFVQGMCHDIEDPTFDATATATNPRAQVRPVHRPPRTPADRHPHCAWTVTIDPDAEPLATPPAAQAMARCEAGTLPLAEAPAGLPTDDGWVDYAGPLDADLVMERFASATLARICDEIALQGHLLARAFLTQVADLLPADEAAEVGRLQAAGVAGVVAKRLAGALGVERDLEGLAAVLEVHPLLAPRTYVAATVDASPDAIGVSLGPCPALREADGLSWPALLAGPHGEAIVHAIAVCIVPTANVERIDGPERSVAQLRITVPAGAEPAPQPDSVTLTEFSTGADFAFTRRA